MNADATVCRPPEVNNLEDHTGGFDGDSGYFEAVKGLLQEINEHGLDCSQPTSEHSEGLDLAYVADRVRSIFACATVTVFFREFDKLFLVASTDDLLKNMLVARQELAIPYKQIEDLTSYVYYNNQNLRIIDTLGQEENSCDRGACVHPEGFAKGRKSIRFMGVPMRTSGRTVGVIRLLRGSDAQTFSKAEEDALTFFGDIFAFFLHYSWRVTISDTIIKAEVEADLISRRESVQNDTVRSIPVIVYADRGAEKLFSLKSNDIEFRDARELYDTDEYERVAELIRSAIRAGAKECGPFKARLKRLGDSGTLWGEITYRMISSPFSTAMYTISVIRDVSYDEMKSAQYQRLFQLLDKRGIAYFRANSNGHTIETSPAETRITGYSEQELLDSMHRGRLYKDRRKRRSFLTSMKLIRRGTNRDEPVRTRQQMKRKNGEIFWSDGVIRLLYNSNSRDIGIEGIYEDVGERIRLENYLDIDSKEPIGMRELYSRLVVAEEFNLNFLTGFGHQLKTPIGAIVGHLMNIKEGIIDDKKALSRLDYAIGQANLCALSGSNLSVINKVLHNDNINMEIVNIREILSSTLIGFAHLLHERKLTLDVDKNGIARHLRIWANRELLRQVFVNLIDNAIKYSHRGSRIRIRGARHEGGRVLEISNQGLPIPEEHREAIFHRGFRTPKARLAVPHGTGLGLWLVKKIVQAHMNSRIECLTEGDSGEERNIIRIMFTEDLAVKDGR